MNNTLKRHLFSALTTFITVAAVSLSAQITNGTPIEWTITFWVGVLIVVARAGVKGVIEGLAGRNAGA